MQNASMLGNIFGGFGLGTILVLAIVGLLVFGKRLPEVGRNLGRGIVEFRKGLKGIQDEAGITEINQAAATDPQQLSREVGAAVVAISVQEPVQLSPDQLRELKANLKAAHRHLGAVEQEGKSLAVQDEVMGKDSPMSAEQVQKLREDLRAAYEQLSQTNTGNDSNG